MLRLTRPSGSDFGVGPRSHACSGLPIGARAFEGSMTLPRARCAPYDCFVVIRIISCGGLRLRLIRPTGLDAVTQIVGQIHRAGDRYFQPRPCHEAHGSRLSGQALPLGKWDGGTGK